MNNRNPTSPPATGAAKRPRHFHDALHPGGVQGVRTGMDTEGSLGSQSGPQPSGGRTGMTEHAGPEDRSDESSITGETSEVGISHLGEEKPKADTPEPDGSEPDGPQASGAAPATPPRNFKR